jgi:uncharacterized protein involved in exopolysaccharide biosynthesis
MTSRVNYVKPAEAESFSLFNRILAGLRRNRKQTYIFLIVVFAASATYYALTPNRYIAVAKIMPAMGNSAGMAKGMMGAKFDGSLVSSLISTRLVTEANTYIEIVGGSPVLDEVLSHEYSGVMGDRSGDLYQLWDIDKKELARIKLLSKSSFSANVKTGTVTISVETTCPHLSAQVANEFVTQLDEFKQALDRSMAGNVSIFLTERIDEQQVKVDEAEEEQAEFYASNRNYLFGDDPTLKLEVERLDRDVFFQRQLLLNLMQLRATSDMEREKELPRLSVLEWASAPQLKSGPARIKSVLLMTIAGMLFVIGIVALRESYDWYFPQETRVELESSYQSVGQDVRNVVNRIRPSRKVPERTEV